MNIVIMGPPGCGKGTQSGAIAATQKVVHISTGDMLRAAVAGGSELGRKVEAVMTAGELVSDGLMMEIIKERLQQEDARRGWLLDGFPRTVPQAEGLVGLLGEIGQGVDRVLVLEVPDEEIVRRLGGRLTCRACGAVTSRNGGGPPAACPACGAEALYTRDDDSEETIRRRLEVFRARTRPAAELLGREYELATIDGRGTPEEVKQRIQGVLQ